MRAAPTLALTVALAAGPLGCGGSDSPGGSVPIGLLLSYSGELAANSINSERALLMGIEAANAAGGVSDRQVAVLSRDTRSDPGMVVPLAEELLASGVQPFIGPDTVALAVQLKALLSEQSVILPSFATSDLNIYKPPNWFVMGATPARIACELMAQLDADARTRRVVIAEPAGHNSSLAFELTKTYGLTTIVLPGRETAPEATVRQITSAAADGYVLAAVPSSASRLLYNLGAVGMLDPPRWYLAPTLHTPALLQTIPQGMLDGASVVATGTTSGATEFAQRFAERWGDQPLDDAYPFYDAAVIAVLALQRAVAREGAIPPGTGLAAHIMAVTRAAGAPVRWNEIDRGLALLREGQEVAYVGLTGTLEFDDEGQTAVASTSWWRIGPKGFEPKASNSTCR